MISPDEIIEITNLYTRYNRSIDAGDAEGWAACFTDDGIFHHPARSWSGTTELRQFVDERTAKFSKNAISDQRHWNDRIEISGESTKATGACDLLVVGVSRDNGSLQIAARGCYSDILEKKPEGWRFLERRLSVS